MQSVSGGEHSESQETVEGGVDPLVKESATLAPLAALFAEIAFCPGTLSAGPMRFKTTYVDGFMSSVCTADSDAQVRATYVLNYFMHACASHVESWTRNIRVPYAFELFAAWCLMVVCA